MPPKVNYDQRMMSQFDPGISSEELQRREAENARRDRQDNIHEALAYIGILEPILDDLGLYWRGDLKELKETLMEMAK